MSARGSGTAGLLSGMAGRPRALLFAGALSLAAAGCAATTGGVHARFGWSNRGLVVRDVPALSTAADAGLLAGDEVLRVDGEDVAKLTEKQVVERLRGPEGSRVTLEVRRAGERETRSITVVRKAYEPRPKAP
jgi:C-terminal processing protease CtpA/Prc